MRDIGVGLGLRGRGEGDGCARTTVSGGIISKCDDSSFKHDKRTRTPRPRAGDPTSGKDMSGPTVGRRAGCVCNAVCAGRGCSATRRRLATERAMRTLHAGLHSVCRGHEKPRIPRTRRTSLVKRRESSTGRRSSRASSCGSWVQPSIGIPFADRPDG